MSLPIETLLIHTKPPFALPGKDAQRLFHGRGRAFSGLEHICIDWLPPVLLLTLYAPEAEADLLRLAQLLARQVPDCSGVVAQYRYEQQGPFVVLQGDVPDTLEVEEAGLRYRLDIGRARNTGLFLDMRNGREWVRQHAQGRQVLNLFAYTCGFSVAALAGGAVKVVNVDLSRPALAIGRENHRLNSHELQGVRFEKLDILRSFGRLARQGPYELLICDPPTLQKGSFEIERDYPKILRRLDQLVTPNADLLLCLNAPHLVAEFLVQAVEEAAPDFRLVQSLGRPASYVESDQGALKALHFQRR